MRRRDLSKALFATAAGAVLLPRQAAAQTSQNYPGNVMNYGAKGDGSTPDDQAFASAIAANNLVIVPDPPVNYVFSQPVALRTGLTIIGNNRSTTIIKPSPNFPRSAGLFQGPSIVANVTIERLGLVMPNVGQNAVGLWFNQARDCTVRGCYILGPSGPAPDHIGIVLYPGTGENIYAGDVLIDNNYIANVMFGIVMSGSCTTVNITNNNLDVGGVSVDGPVPPQYGSCGIDTSAGATGVLIQGNSFQGWNYGVLTYGGYIRQIGNYFEDNITDWFWALGAGNTGIWNSSIGDANPSTAGLNSYPPNTGCIVLGQGWKTW